MKLEREHGDHYQFPVDTESPDKQTHVQHKETQKVQTVRGDIDYPVSAPEYYSRLSYDFLYEVRAAINADTPIDFGLIVKRIWIRNTDPNTTNASLYVSFDGTPASDQNRSIQIVPGEVREFAIPVRRIRLGVAAGQNTGYRLTWGY